MKAFVMRLLLAGNFSHLGLSAHLEQRRAQVAAQCDALGQAVARTQPEAKSGQFLAIDYGLALASVELSWLDHTLDALPSQPSAQEDVGNEIAT